jgi:nucleolar protein TMA23
MDSHAILTSQGWRGKGHSLHPTDNAIGLSKPLLVGRKKDRTGVGQVLHHTSDQWWLHAFDQKLKGLDTSKRGALTQTVKQGKLDAVAVGRGKYAGLYADFVRGETLDGTATPESGEASSSGRGTEEAGRSKARRREERKARKEARKARKAEEAHRTIDGKEGEAPVPQPGLQTPEVQSGAQNDSAEDDILKRRARKEERRKRKEEKRRLAAGE